MEHILQGIKLVSAGLAAAATFLFGGFDALLKVFLVFLLLDYITGLLAAVYTKTISSSVGMHGILKKVAMLLVVALAHLVGKTTGVLEIRSMVLGFYIANEAISLLENAGRMGVAFPPQLREMLEQLKEK